MPPQAPQSPTATTRFGSGVAAWARRFDHVPRYRPRDQQQIGVTRTRDEANAGALQVVIRILERVDLELAAIARTGIDLADIDRPLKDARDLGVQCFTRAQLAFVHWQRFAEESG